MFRKSLICLALLCLAVPAFGQTPFNFSTPTEIAGVSETSYAYMVELDVAGSPVIRCWKDGGLMEKTCGLIGPAPVRSAGFHGFLITFISPTGYDLRQLVIDRGENFPYDASPDWSVSYGCVTDTEELGNGPVGANRLITISGGEEEIEARCNTGDIFVGNLFGPVCAHLTPGDCGTFGGDNGSPYRELTQAIARKGE